MVWVDRFLHIMSCYSFVNWTRKYEEHECNDGQWATIFTVIPIVLCQIVFLLSLYVIAKAGYIPLAIVVALCFEAKCSNFIWYDSIRKLTTANVLLRNKKNHVVEKQRAYTAGIVISLSHFLIKAISFFTLFTLVKFSVIINSVLTAGALQAFAVILAALLTRKTKSVVGYGINSMDHTKFPQFIIGVVLSCIIIFLCNYWLYGIILIIATSFMTIIAEKIIEYRHNGIFEEAICAIGEIIFMLVILLQIAYFTFL